MQMLRPRPPQPPYAGESYHGRPALKPTPWNWTVSGYIFLAGTAGAAQALGWIGSRADPRAWRGAVRNARLLALGSSAAGAGLLIADLRTPSRWYNMLRILRPTSPMSVGTYILTAFGVFSAIGGLGELPLGHGRAARWLARSAEVAQPGAALTGAGAATYTASLMSATSTPEWAAAPRALGMRFAASAIACGAAALALGERAGGRSAAAHRLEAVAALATVAQLWAGAAGKAAREEAGIEDYRPADAERRRLDSAELLLAGIVPLGAYAADRLAVGRQPLAAAAGSLSLLAGGALLRHAVMRAGMASARRPRVSLRFAQPDNLPARRRADRSRLR
jgi:protein NrfD